MSTGSDLLMNCRINLILTVCVLLVFLTLASSSVLKQKTMVEENEEAFLNQYQKIVEIDDEK